MRIRAFLSLRGLVFGGTWLFLTGFFFFANSNVLNAQGVSLKYSKVRITIESQDDLIELQRIGIGSDHFKLRNRSIELVLNNREVELLEKSSKPYEILVDDLVAEYEQRAKFSTAQVRTLRAEMKEEFNVEGFDFGSMGGYYTFDEVVTVLDEMRALYPTLISVKQSIGLSLEGRDIWMVRISDNPDVDEDEQEIIYTALHHAREPQSMATIVYFMFYLLENYGIDSEVTDLVDNRELYFVPVVDPDGYVYNQTTNPNGGGLWRKNRRDNGDGTFGVDLNRNYGYQWGVDDIGSSPFTFSGTYRGTAAFSEPETQVMRDFCLNHDFTMAFNYHSYTNLLIFPWGYIANFFTSDHDLFVSLSQDMTQFNGYTYGTANQTVGYLVNGEANDWFYGEQTQKNKILAFTPEVGGFSDGFWPAIDRIIPLADENVYPNLVLAAGIDTTATGGPPVVSDIPDAEITGTFVQLNMNDYVDDPDHADSEMTWTWSGNVDLIVQYKSTSQLVRVSAPAGWTGSETITFTATDPDGNSDSDAATFSIDGGGGGGEVPVVSDIPDQTISARITLSMDQYVDDPDNADSEITWSWSGNSDLTVQYRSGTRQIRITPPGGWTGSETITFTATDPDGNSDSDAATFSATILASKTGASGETISSVIPETMALDQNYPNPFNPNTSIRYALNSDNWVTVKIYNMLGEEIVTLVNEYQNAGFKTIVWDGRNEIGRPVASGIYIYQMTAGDFVQSQKMIFAK